MKCYLPEATYSLTIPEALRSFPFESVLIPRASQLYTLQTQECTQHILLGV